MMPLSSFLNKTQSILFTLFLAFQMLAQAATVDLFILAGQSNGNGQGLVSNLPAGETTQNAMLFNSWHTFINNASDVNSPLNHSGWISQTVAGNTRAKITNGAYCPPPFGGSQFFGPEMGFVSRANAINLTSNAMGIIKYAVDGSKIDVNVTQHAFESDWDTTATGDYSGDCWRGFQASLAEAVTQLQNAGHTPNFRGMIWWQGESGTNATALNTFITAVRNHLGTTYSVPNASEFPIVITGNAAWGSGLEAGVATPDDKIGYIDSKTYGQTTNWTNTHIGSGENGQSLDQDDIDGDNNYTGNGINDMFDIGVAFADEMAAILPAPTGGNVVDLFMATGQSNAFYPNNQGAANYFGFGRGVQSELTASGLFSNPTVVMDGAPGFAIAGWWAEYLNGGAGGPNIKYDEQFFDTDGNGTGKLEAKIDEIIANGDTPCFRGLFWFQGESDGIGPYATANTSQAVYEARWAGLLAQLEADLAAKGLATDKYNFVVNTVAESGAQINTILTGVGNNAANGAIFDTQVAPYFDQDIIVEAQYGNLHDYDHFAVGEANVNLFINSFVNPVTTYDITFINVDGTQTVQTVNENVVAIPPAGVNTIDKTFTSWPTIAPATADATYTALYDVIDPDNFVDVFIATGQSNAWGPANDGLWHPTGTNTGTYEFGQGVASILENSNKFSNPVVVLEGAPGQPISAWWWEGDANITFNAPNVLYKQQFFDAANPGVATLDAKFAEIIATGKIPRFRGLFWFQGENDGGYNGTSNPNAATPDATYKVRWNGFLNQIASDVGTSDFNFVVNTVGLVDPAINATLASIANLDSRGAILDTQVAPYRDMEPGTTNVPNGDVHGYDHFAVGVANAQLYLDTFCDLTPPTTYEITFINVDDSQTTQTANAGDTPTPPAGVNTATRTFTSWPTIAPATADATYTALFTVTGGGGPASVSTSLSQGGSGTPINLTTEGTLDWAVFSNSTLTPSGSMSGGTGYTSMAYLGAAANAFYNYNSSNTYTWTNGTPNASGSNTLTTNASLGSNGDGLRLTFNLPSAGTYQLKFYNTTADTNLSATATLSGGATDTTTGTLQSGLQRYDFTIDFTTAAADTLTLDVVKDGGGVVLAYEAFSLSFTPAPTVTSNGTPHSWLDSYGLVTGGDYEAADLLDSDGDGVSNLEEYIVGTDPTDGSSVLKLCISSDGSNSTLTWTPVSGKTYDIEHSPDLGQNTPWQIHQANVPYTAGQDVSIIIPQTNTKQFFRVSVR